VAGPVHVQPIDGKAAEQGAHSEKMSDPVELLKRDFFKELKQGEGVFETLTALPFSFRFGSRTAFDHKKREVIIGVEQLARMGITDPRQVAFVVLHELGHFKELVDDPEGYKKVISEGTRHDGLGKAYFRFYNALMDIYVNTNTRNKTAIYGGDDFSPEIKELYQKRLFDERDLRQLPLSTQFAYYILNMGMGVARDLTVSPKVAAKLKEPCKLYGSTYSVEGIIENFLRPAIGMRNTKEWQATISQRKVVIDKTLRPVFESLIQEDIKNGQDPNQGSWCGDLEGVEASPEDLREAADEIIRQRAEANKSAEQKAADERRTAAEELAKRHLSPEEAKGLAETSARVQPAIVELVNLLKQIVDETVEYKKRAQGFFKKGSVLNIGRAISQFAKIDRGAEVMTRNVYEEVRLSFPQEVRVWLCLDLSGSMQGDTKLLRDLCVTFAGALQTLSMGAKMGQHTLRGSLGIVGFNDSAIDVLPLTKDPTYEDIAKAYKYLSPDGGTSEHLALTKIVQAIEADPPCEGRVDIVVGITDGDTSDPSASHTLVCKLEDLGAKLVAFQFNRGYVAPDVQKTPEEMSKEGGFMPDAPPPNTFASIWRTPKSGQLGFCVRRAIHVIPAMRARLSDILKAL
jgi:hypothetical protein